MLKIEFNWTLTTYITTFRYYVSVADWKGPCTDAQIKEYFDAQKEPKKAAASFVEKQYKKEFRRITTLFKNDMEKWGRRSLELKKDFLKNHPTQCPSKLLSHADNIQACENALNPPKK